MGEFMSACHSNDSASIFRQRQKLLADVMLTGRLMRHRILPDAPPLSGRHLGRRRHQKRQWRATAVPANPENMYRSSLAR